MKTDSTYKKTTLRSGLRVVTERLPGVRSISLGVWVGVGARFETPEQNGLSHLIEHMVFKGTTKRTAKQIAESLEMVGGSLNAFTSREQTCFTARVLDDHLEKAVDVLADMTCHAKFSASDLRLEKKVILEEIKEAFETPSDRIHDAFASTLWGNQPIGRPILGPAENVANFHRRDILDYMRRNYVAGSILIAASGNVSHRRLLELVRKYFEFDRGVAPEALPANRPTAVRVEYATGNGDQTHLCLGFPALSFYSPKKMAALALNCHLGGGMSSVLFQKIREQRGLAYSVYTYLDFYRDTGVFGTYVGTDKEHVAEAVAIVLQELERLKNRRLSKMRLQAIKDQLQGQLTLGMESTAAHMNRVARQEMYLGEFRTLDQTLEEINKVTTSDILNLANEIFDRSVLALATLGPVDKTAVENVL